jgi:hypothetical protein
MSIPRTTTRLCLEHGTDETSTDSVRVEERGVTFESPWQFEPLAELLLCLAWQHPRLGSQRTPISGIVVDSRRTDDGRFETVVLFSRSAGGSQIVCPRVCAIHALAE